MECDDTEQPSSCGVAQTRELKPSQHISLSPTGKSRGHVPNWLGKSMPNIPIEGVVLGVHHVTTAVSYHEGDIDSHRHTNRDDCDWMDDNYFPQMNNTMITHEASRNNCYRVPSVDLSTLHTSSLPLASSDDCLPCLSMSNVSLEHDMGKFHECVPVEGRLADLSDNEEYCDNDGSDTDEGGIVILDESTEDEYEEAVRESSGNSHRARPHMQSPSLNTSCITKTSMEARMGITQASMYENDSIVLEAAARVNATFSAANPSFANESLDFEQLLREADDHSYTRMEDEGQAVEINVRDTQNVSGMYFWRRKPCSASSGGRPEPRQQPRGLANLTSQSHTPVCATRIRHDKYVVEISILRPRDMADQSSYIREVIDIMANIELLHLWFDAIPAVFDATIKDGGIGSGNRVSSPQPSVSSPSNSMEGNDGAANNENNRQYDGQWVEISTPPLKIPSDSRISGCLRAARVSIQSLLGFPLRMRSMIFVERSCGRMGMTLGPFPDGFLCNSGTMAFHTFKVRISNDEEIGDCVIISDEVRLQRGGVDDDFIGRTRRTCCSICSIFRVILCVLEWVLLCRWYQPDMASYMQQSCSSLEKLRSLVERGGESAAYHGGGELIMGGEDCQGENATRTLGSPLLG